MIKWAVRSIIVTATQNVRASVAMHHRLIAIPLTFLPTNQESFNTEKTKYMSRSENRHYEKVHKKKEHPAAKCGNAKCMICHANKVMKVPTRKLLQENSKINKSMFDDEK